MNEYTPIWYTLDDYYPLDSDPHTPEHIRDNYEHAIDLIDQTIHTHTRRYNLDDDGYQLIPHQTNTYTLLLRRAGLNPQTATSRQIWDKLHARVLTINPPAYTPDQHDLTYLVSHFTGHALLLWGEHQLGWDENLTYDGEIPFDPFDTPDGKYAATGTEGELNRWNNNVLNHNRMVSRLYHQTLGTWYDDEHHTNPGLYNCTELLLQKIPDDWQEFTSTHHYPHDDELHDLVNPEFM